MYDGDRGNFYDALNEQSLFKTPDGMLYQKNLEDAKNQLRAAYDEEAAPPDDEIVRRTQIALDKTRDLLELCGLTAGWFGQDAVRIQGEKYLKQQIALYYPS